MRPLRTLVVFKLGAWVGMLAAAAFIKRALPSRGDEESDELTLVAVFDGIDLKSRAKGFKGGSVLAWFGGIALDLRDAELAPGRASPHIPSSAGWRSRFRRVGESSRRRRPSPEGSTSRQPRRTTLTHRC